MRYYDGKRAMTMGEIRETFSRKGLLGSLRNDLDEFGKFIGKRVGEDPDLMDRTGSDQIDVIWHPKPI